MLNKIQTKFNVLVKIEKEFEISIATVNGISEF